MRFHDFKMSKNLSFISTLLSCKHFQVVSGLFARIRDFRFQDIKDFIEDFSSQPQFFKLVADSSAKKTFLIHSMQ